MHQFLQHFVFITLSIPDVEKAFSFLTEVRVEDCLPFYGGINANKNVKLCWATEWRTNNYEFATDEVLKILKLFVLSLYNVAKGNAGDDKHAKTTLVEECDKPLGDVNGRRDLLMILPKTKLFACPLLHLWFLLSMLSHYTLLTCLVPFLLLFEGFSARAADRDPVLSSAFSPTLLITVAWMSCTLQRSFVVACNESWIIAHRKTIRKAMMYF